MLSFIVLYVMLILLLIIHCLIMTIKDIEEKK